MNVESLGYRTDLMVRRLAGSTISDLGEFIRVTTDSNPTFHWGNFVLAGTDVANAERWLETFRAVHPTAEHVAIGLEVTAVDDVLRAAYAAAGLEVWVSDVLSARSLTAPASLDGVVCRAVVGDDDWAQVRELTFACNEITEPHAIAYADLKQAEWRAIAEAGHGGWFGAFVDGRLGSTLGIVTDGMGFGRYQAVETHPSYRRRGLARALITSSAATVRADYSIAELVIVADPEYHAAELYRSVGFRSADIQVQVSRAS